MRLACFDRLAGTVAQPPAEQPAGVAPVMAPPATTAVAEARKDSAGFSLSDHWELDEAHKRDIFKFRPHGANYLIGTYTHAPNDALYRPFPRLIRGRRG